MSKPIRRGIIKIGNSLLVLATVNNPGWNGSVYVDMGMWLPRVS